MSDKLESDCRLAASIMKTNDMFSTGQGILIQAADALATKDAKITRLRMALAPFAYGSPDVSGRAVILDHSGPVKDAIRTARAALEATNDHP